MDNDKRIELIKTRISQSLSPEVLEVIDDSDRHKNHPGAKSGKGHFIVNIKAQSLDGLSRLKAHQKIYASVTDLFDTDIHALNIHIIS
ncbi:BolA family transcriptional regulator [Thiotrichales bacterium 19S3-7]|nr:BolA family transcriptional regulator [Thiotrichales bacterium 19S3-7]MCF6801249.1 BolA family transcriptional regulator [Thiotrichales bacterium 19S3-11]